MNTAKVSIVLITRNRLGLLKERSLKSALEQDCSNFECVVVDDCSSDGTESFMKDLASRDHRIKYFRHETNHGASAARNTGVKMSTGDYIVFLDDDDALDKDFLKETVPALSALPEDYGALSVGRHLISKYGKEYIVPRKDPQSFYAAIDDGWLLRKKVFEKISWDEDLYHDDDAAFGMDFFKYFRAGFLDKLLFYKYGPVGAGKKYLSFGLPSPKRLKGMDNFVAKYLPVIEASGNNKEIVFWYRYIGKTYCTGKVMYKGLLFLTKAYKFEPSPRNLLNLAAAKMGHRVYWQYSRLEASLIRFLGAQRK